MSQNAAKYKAYKFLLESDIPPQHRDLMLEKLGIFQQLKSFFGGAKEMGGEMLDVVKNKAYQRQLVMAQQNMEEALQDLRDIAKKAGKDDAFVNALLQSFLKGSGVDPAAIASASPSDEGGGESGGGSAGGTAPGAPVTSQTVSQNPQLQIALLQAATGKPSEQIATQVKDKKLGATAITKVVARAAAKATGVKDEVASKAIQVLFDTGKLKLESRSFRVKKSHESALVFERWQRLAGVPVSLLVERDATEKNKAWFDEISKAIDTGEIKDAAALATFIKDAASDTSGSEKTNLGALTKAMKKDLARQLATKNPKEDKKAIEKALQKAPEAEASGSAAGKEDAVKNAADKLVDAFKGDSGLEKDDIVNVLKDPKLMQKYKLGELTDEQKNAVVDEVMKQVKSGGSSGNKEAAAAAAAATEMSDTAEDLKKKLETLTKQKKFSDDNSTSAFSAIIKMLTQQMASLSESSPETAKSIKGEIDKLKTQKASAVNLGRALELSEKLSGQLAMNLQNTKYNSKLSSDQLKDQLDAMQQGRDELDRIALELESENEALQGKLAGKNKEAEELAKQLEQSKKQQEEFKANLAKSLGMKPDDLTAKIEDQGFEGLIASVMAKKPEAVEKAAAAAGVESSSSDTKTSSSAQEKIDAVREKIKPEEISDDDLKKVVDWVEEFLDKATEAAAEVSK